MDGAVIPLIPTRVPEGMSHLQYLLGETLTALDQGRADVAVTNFTQAVRVAAAGGTLDFKAEQMLQRLCKDYGGFA
jgi:ABC-type amino acid transport substrate-binding protein